MRAVNTWHPALFILAGSGYHSIMLAGNVFGFAGVNGSGRWVRVEWVGGRNVGDGRLSELPVGAREPT